MKLLFFSGLFIASALTAILPAVAQSSTPIHVTVDVTDAPRKILHARLTIPVTPGPLTLLYAKWIPGEHSPDGPIDDLAGLVFTANGQEIPWVRDDVNMYAFHLTVPQGVTMLDAKCDFLATAAATGFSAGASTSASLAVLSWNEVVLYPSGHQSADISVEPAVTLPAGWQYGTALTKTSQDGSTIHFAAVSLEQLVDSPLLTGRYFKEFPLAPEITPKHYLDIAADGPEDLRLSSSTLDAFSNLIRETGALYKSRHYDSYHFLVTASDQVSHFGLEHHQSSDDRVPEKTFVDDNLQLLSADLLPHEFTHSWNGKYRRPAGLATGNYEDPMKGNLLWVYEGLTQYYGDVLAARSKIETPSEYRDALASSAATLDYRPGRTWRDLQDTATAAQTLYEASPQWDNWRRNVDYYPEGELVWLDVDTSIRRLTNDKKSLNDFAARFLGLGGNTQPKVVPYTFDDIVANLNAVVPYDWAGFLRQRLTSKSPHAPLDGIEHGGYRLVYTDQPSEYTQARAAGLGESQAWWAIGINVSNDGHIDDVLMGSVSDKSGLGPGMQIIAVNGRQFSPQLLGDAITGAKGSKTPIELIVVNTGYYKIVHLDYYDGLRFPHLERVDGTPDLLDEIIAPLTGKEQAPAKN
ncbi:M61 family metallopeptidase [Paracidobacterium acidisoli]|uniref:M61 family metallopeptidase n=1 Tax=Paracidobacterium acidisoli TaxID=2303751 RepID=UPI0026B9345B